MLIDGQFSPQNDLNRFTACARFQLNYIRGVVSYLLSYAYEGADNALAFGKLKSSIEKLHFL